MREVIGDRSIPAMFGHDRFDVLALILRDVESQQRQMLRGSGRGYRIENRFVKVRAEKELLPLFEVENNADLLHRRQTPNRSCLIRGKPTCGLPMVEPLADITIPEIDRVLIRAATGISSSRRNLAA